MANEMQEYIEGIKPGEVWLFPKIDPIKQRRYYCQESIAHPAKMPVFLAQKLIMEYSKEGDLVLDVMCGIGTTVIEAILLGRNAIGIEYESKFFSICEKNLKLVQIFKPKGIGKFIKGDSRKLTELLQQSVDSVIMSPPFGPSLAGSASDNVLKFKHGSAGKDYTDNKNDLNQIGNLKYEVDSVIFSPPFASEMVQKQKDSTKTYMERIGRYAQYGDENMAFHGTQREPLSILIRRYISNVWTQNSNALIAELKLTKEQKDALSVMAKFLENKELGSHLQNHIGELWLKIIGQRNQVMLILAEENQTPMQAEQIIEIGKAGKNIGAGLDIMHQKRFLTTLLEESVKYADSFQQTNQEIHQQSQLIMSYLSKKGEVMSFPISLKSVADVMQNWKTNCDHVVIHSTKESEKFVPALKNQSTNYLEAMLLIYKQCFVVLKPGGLMVLVTKNFTKNQKLVRIDLDTIKTAELAGFRLKERRYRRMDSASFWIKLASKNYYKKNPDKMDGAPFAEYEDVLVFTK